VIYYLLQGNEIIQKIDTDDKGFIYLPPLSTEEAMSLVNEVHLKALSAGKELEPLQVIEALGITDARRTEEKPVDDWLKAVAADVKPVDGLPIGDVKLIEGLGVKG
jgi:hypothetical protein